MHNMPSFGGVCIPGWDGLACKPVISHTLLQVAANLMTDEMLMRSAQLTPEYRPLVDFHVQYSTTQSQKGWRYGFTDASRPMERNTTFHEMVWHPHKNGHLADGRWQATEAGPRHPWL